ncbi:hypothetical protein [Thermaerobacillus caldiproteolyticus]|uniref:hypothetical protein n=1 Tax=Thermaerobacillus caldiproteolyticus TaxID=247480 RepID=UPI0018F125FC|nr:hypothetical protein [Anoxybacillus caldiproteolyticus]
MAIIKAPNKNYTGVSASLAFVNGQAETEDKWLIQWFKERGYEVIEEEQEQTNLDDLKVEQIKAKLDELGIEYKSSENKDKLLEKLKSALEKSE